MLAPSFLGMNIAAFVTPYVKEVTRSLSTAILVFASTPRCPNCVVTCQPTLCPDCICREGVRESAPTAAVSWWPYICVALLSFQSGILVHCLWAKCFTVTGSVLPPQQVALTSRDSRSPSSQSSGLEFIADRTDISSSLSTESDFQVAARNQAALLKKNRNGISR